jgi:isoleucyl-tRNA synthetase
MVPALDSRVESSTGTRAQPACRRNARSAAAQTHAGYRRARHVVQLRAVAIFDARLAGRHRRPAHVLSHQPADQRLRHFVLLGRAHDHDGAAPHGRRQSLAAVPFRRLYLHSLVRTAEGAKMSKTKGTGVDPLELTQKFGTDALRYMLASMAAPGTDIILARTAFSALARSPTKSGTPRDSLFVNLEKVESQGDSLDELAAPEIRAKPRLTLSRAKGALAHRWIFSRLSAVAAQVNDALENFRFHEALPADLPLFLGRFLRLVHRVGEAAIHCERSRNRVPAWRNIFAALDAALRLLHPVMPFLTEELWHRLPQSAARNRSRSRHFPSQFRSGATKILRGRWLTCRAESFPRAISERN